MAYTSAYAVVVGAATKKTDIDGISVNTDYLQTLANVDHNFHVSTGTGYHKASHSAPLHLYNGTDHAVLWLDYATDATRPQLRVKFASGSVPSPSSVSDGQPLQAGPETAASPGPGF